MDHRVKVHMGQGQIRVPNKGRCAHDNVKLLHLNLICKSKLIGRKFNTNLVNK